MLTAVTGINWGDEGKGIRQSMSKAGCPYDNSPMESFYGTFKSEFIRQNRLKMMLEAKNLELAGCYYEMVKHFCNIHTEKNH